MGFWYLQLTGSKSNQLLHSCWRHLCRFYLRLKIWEQFLENDKLREETKILNVKIWSEIGLHDIATSGAFTPPLSDLYQIWELPIHEKLKISSGLGLKWYWKYEIPKTKNGCIRHQKLTYFTYCLSHRELFLLLVSGAWKVPRHYSRSLLYSTVFVRQYLRKSNPKVKKTKNKVFVPAHDVELKRT